MIDALPLLEVDTTTGNAVECQDQLPHYRHDYQIPNTTSIKTWDQVHTAYFHHQVHSARPPPDNSQGPIPAGDDI